MASSANNTSNEGPLNIKHIDLVDPDKCAIAVVLGEALNRNYTKVTVEWVTSHPDLSEPPFNLAARGIYGNTALLDFGDMSYLKSPFFKRNTYNFKQFLKNIDRDNSDSFIFGHGICLFKDKLRELVLNTSFLPATSKEEPESKNRSRLTYINSALRTCVTETLELSNLKCTAQGTYFLCDGSTTEWSVLKVRAKGLRSSNAPLSGFRSNNASSSESKRFINSMQEALQKRFGSEQFVALGGVYTVDNAKWKHKLIPNYWEPLSKNTVAHYYCKVDTPETMITIFNSSTELHSIKGPPIKLHSSQSLHSLSHHSSSVSESRIFDPENVEYLGYFCPATKVYRIDEPL